MTAQLLSAALSLVPANRSHAEVGKVIDAIVWVSRDHQFDPWILLAWAWHESSLRPKAANKKTGARGLLQVLPKTLKRMPCRGWNSIPCRGWNSIDPESLDDSATCLDAGIDYLHLLHAYYATHSLPELLSAYRGGIPRRTRYADRIISLAKKLRARFGEKTS